MCARKKKTLSSSQVGDFIYGLDDQRNLLEKHLLEFNSNRRGGSCLISGRRNSGKTLVLDSLIRIHFPPGGDVRVKRINGSDYSRSFAKTSKLFGQLVENLEDPLLFVVDHFEHFALKLQQNFLYSILNGSKTRPWFVILIGTTENSLTLLEKRRWLKDLAKCWIALPFRSKRLRRQKRKIVMLFERVWPKYEQSEVRLSTLLRLCLQAVLPTKGKQKMLKSLSLRQLCLLNCLARLEVRMRRIASTYQEIANEYFRFTNEHEKSMRVRIIALYRDLDELASIGALSLTKRSDFGQIEFRKATSNVEAGAILKTVGTGKIPSVVEGCSSSVSSAQFLIRHFRLSVPASFCWSMTKLPWFGPCRGDNVRRLSAHSGFVLTLATLSAVFAFASCADAPADLTTTVVVCPLSLSQVGCTCNVLSQSQSVQILCNGTQPDKVWGFLDGFGPNIDKLAIRRCPTNNKSSTLKQLLPLKIRSLEISHCSIDQIQPNAFDAIADSLEELSLDGNALTSFPKINKLKRIQSLNFNSNSIKEVPDSTFTGLKELRFLRLRMNNICNLMPNLLSDQKGSLELLDLSYNCFSSVPSAALRNCVELRWLNLAGNAIEGIKPMQFMSLPNLIELRLHSNGLKRIATNGFMNVPALRHLFLQNNKLGMLDSGTLQAFKELQLVDLNSNIFYKIPSFKDMLELVEIRLHNNQIRSIETLAFSGIPKLRRILLHNNQIETIARNSFDSLDNLEVLILYNNYLTVIEKGVLDGVKGLKNLILRNNSVEELSRDSFASVPELTMLDLSDNELRTLRSGTFVPLQRLHLLSLANNGIETVEKGTFDGKVDNVLLDGNPLRCDAQLDWFISWLVKNRVRTFMPNQPEIQCASPEENKGKRLKDLMIEKSNITEALVNSFNSMNLARGSEGNAAAQNLLKMLPGITRQVKGAQIGTEVLGSLAESFPEIRSLPGMRLIPTTIHSQHKSNGKTLNAAIDQFSEPLVKFATGATPSSSDVSKLLSSIPDLVVNIPGVGGVDISKLNPSLVEHVMNGGQIPGIPKETLDRLVKQYMQQLYVAAAQAQGRTTTEFPPLPTGTDPSKFLRPISELPNGMIQSVVQNKPLPHLTSEQTEVIKQYYVQQLPSSPGDINKFVAVNNSGEPFNMTGILPPRALQMMKFLPPNYDMSKIPPEVTKQVLRGEMPDLTKLPSDLHQWIKDNLDRLVASLENSSDLSIDDILKKLPTFENPPMSTFSPYDINKIDSDLVVQQRNEDEKNERYWRIFAACALGLAGAVTLGVLSAFFWCLRRSRHTPNLPMVPAMAVDGVGALPSVVREQSFRPSASSTLK
uniref:LRRCT domain-containing protein n=1 Tax=Globodera rostochiensis TaxID=31243 RepID=A0A914HNJ3_GLORO